MITILKDCWLKVEQAYKQGRICSERHMQAEIFHFLKQNKSFTDQYKIFVEPKIYSDNIEIKKFGILGIIPDLVITHQDKISCIFEIKYTPHKAVKYIKDINNFSKFNNFKDSEILIYLETDPKTGQWNKNRQFSMSSSLFFAYGIIASKNSDAITRASEIWKETPLNTASIQNYLYLIGSVNHKGEPSFSFKISETIMY